MKKSHKNIWASAVLCLALAVSAVSCSDDRPDPRATLLGQVGPDFNLLVVTNPTLLARSAGEEALKKLHATDSEMFRLIATSEGVDQNVAVAVTYSNPVQSALLLPVTNAGKLSRSLEQAGWKKSGSDGMASYSNGDAHSILVDEKVMWLVRTGSNGNAAATVTALKGRAGELPAWLDKRLNDVADRPAAFCVASSDSTHFFGSLSLDGSSAEAKVIRIDTDGLRLTLVGADRRQTPGSVLKAVDPGAAVALSMALPTDFNIEQFIHNSTGWMYITDRLRHVISHLDGRIGLSVNLADPTDGDMADLNNYRVALGLGTADGSSKAALNELSDIARQTGIPMDGSSVAYGGKAILTGSAPESDLLMIATPGYKPLPCPENAKDKLLWLRIKLPAGAPLLDMLNVESGLDIKADVTPQEAVIKMNFPGSGRGFIANLIDIAGAF